jgi:hypothetical protein
MNSSQSTFSGQQVANIMQGLSESSIAVGILIILVALVYVVVAIQALLVLPKYFV